MQKRTLSIGNGSWVGIATLGLALVAGPAKADPTCQIPPASGLDPECLDDVGAPVCFTTPRFALGLTGMPTWPADAGILNYDAATSAGLRDEISDPRWSNAPLRGLEHSGNTSSSRVVLYRVMIDSAAATEAAVSIQFRTMASSPTVNDFVYFGLATAAGDAAWGIRVPIGATGAGSHVPVAATSYNTYSYNGTTWDGKAGAPTNGWLKDGLVSVWRAPELYAINGATVSVQFKVKLDRLGLQQTTVGGQLVNQRARIMVGAEAAFGGAVDIEGKPVPNGAPFGQLKFSVPNLSNTTVPKS